MLLTQMILDRLSFVWSAFFVLLDNFGEGFLRLMSQLEALPCVLKLHVLCRRKQFYCTSLPKQHFLAHNLELHIFLLLVSCKDSVQELLFISCSISSVV